MGSEHNPGQLLHRAIVVAGQRPKLREMDACSECGFVYEELPVAEVADVLRGLIARYRRAVRGAPDAAVRTRPEPSIWSALEYACHFRDVLLVQRERVILAQVAERPSLPPMSRDARVEWCAYDAQRTSDALDQLEMAVELFALVFERVGPRGWDRTVLYNFPEPTERDVGWVGRHSVHEGVHHLADIEHVLDAVASTEPRP
jgi:hypothetical protein